jgi:hypothetical protein
MGQTPKSQFWMSLASYESIHTCANQSVGPEPAVLNATTCQRPNEVPISGGSTTNETDRFIIMIYSSYYPNLTASAWQIVGESADGSRSENITVTVLCLEQ